MKRPGYRRVLGRRLRSLSGRLDSLFLEKKEQISFLVLLGNDDTRLILLLSRSRIVYG